MCRTSMPTQKSSFTCSRFFRCFSLGVDVGKRFCAKNSRKDLSMSDSALEFRSDWGRVASTGFLFIGINPHFRNPDFRMLGVFCIDSNAKLRWCGNCAFPSVPACFVFQAVRTRLHAILNGRKNATSRGCSIWVEFGGRNTKLMLFSSHLVMTFTDK